MYISHRAYNKKKENRKLNILTASHIVKPSFFLWMAVYTYICLYK